MNFGAKTRLRHSYFRGNRDGSLCFLLELLHRTRRVKKYKRNLSPVRRAVTEFIYHYHGERNHQGLGNAFVFLDTTGLSARRCQYLGVGSVLNAST